MSVFISRFVSCLGFYITAGTVLTFITSQYLVTYQLKQMQIFKHYAKGQVRYSENR